jgi:hypothetical protein
MALRGRREEWGHPTPVTKPGSLLLALAREERVRGEAEELV